MCVCVGGGGGREGGRKPSKGEHPSCRYTSAVTNLDDIKFKVIPSKWKDI